MKNKIFKIGYLLFIVLMIIALVVFMVIHITHGLAGANEKLILGGYVLMIIWALMKLYNAIKR